MVTIFPDFTAANENGSGHPTGVGHKKGMACVPKAQNY